MADMSPKRQTQVISELEYAESRLTDLFNTVDMLEERLRPILSVPELGMATKTKEEEALVPLAAKIQEHTSVLSSAIGRLQSILSRIEI